MPDQVVRRFCRARLSLGCKTDPTATSRNDYVARREAVQKAKQAGDAQQIAAGAKDAATKDEWRWQPTDASRLVHMCVPSAAHPSHREIVSDPFGHNSVAALGVSDQSEIEWKAIDDPRLAIHGPKNLRDRFRHLVKTAKREVQNERPRTPEGAAQEVSFQSEREAIVEASSVPRLTPGYLQMPSRSF